MFRKLRQNIQSSIDDNRAQMMDPATYDSTLETLFNSGELTTEEVELLRARLSTQVDKSGYILQNLGAHLGIGVVFAFDVIPLPLGTIGRVSWVAGARILETSRRRYDKARVHSVAVFVIAAVPWIGYGAYLLPLRRDATELTFVIANHIWIKTKGQSYEEFLNKSSKPIRRIGRWLAPSPFQRTSTDVHSPGC